MHPAYCIPRISPLWTRCSPFTWLLLFWLRLRFRQNRIDLSICMWIRFGIRRNLAENGVYAILADPMRMSSYKLRSTITFFVGQSNAFGMVWMVQWCSTQKCACEFVDTQNTNRINWSMRWTETCLFDLLLSFRSTCGNVSRCQSALWEKLKMAYKL